MSSSQAMTILDDPRFQKIDVQLKDAYDALRNGSLSVTAAKELLKKLSAEQKSLEQEYKLGLAARIQNLPPPIRWPEPPEAIEGFTIHPFAALFPQLEGWQFAELCQDIKEKGLLNPIVLDEGKIIDGRNRLRACREAGVTPLFIEFEDLNLDCSVEEYIFSNNIQRRHLSDDQRAALVMRFREKLAAEAKRRQQEAGGDHAKKALRAESPEPLESQRTREKLADLAGVSQHKIKLAEQVQRSQPGILRAVAAGHLKLSAATKHVSASEQRKAKARIDASAEAGRVGSRIEKMIEAATQNMSDEEKKRFYRDLIARMDLIFKTAGEKMRGRPGRKGHIVSE
jgi:ParB-like chromosome segregation protein Spo0J